MVLVSSYKNWVHTLFFLYKAFGLFPLAFVNPQTGRSLDLSDISPSKCFAIKGTILLNESVCEIFLTWLEILIFLSKYEMHQCCVCRLWKCLWNILVRSTDLKKSATFFADLGKAIFMSREKKKHCSTNEIQICSKTLKRGNVMPISWPWLSGGDAPSQWYSLS